MKNYFLRVTLLDVKLSFWIFYRVCSRSFGDHVRLVIDLDALTTDRVWLDLFVTRWSGYHYKTNLYIVFGTRTYYELMGKII
jgi:hypothetical protein